MQSRRSPWSTQTKTIVVLLILGLGIYLLYRFNAVIKPFILALILAYVLAPLANWFQGRLKIHRGAATVLSYLALVTVTIAILALLVPLLAEQVARLDLDFQRFVDQVEALLGRQYSLAGWVVDADMLVRQLDSLVRGVVEPIFSQTLSMLIEVISSFVWVIFVAVVTFYLIKDSPKFSRWMENTVPPAYREDYIRIRQELNLIWSAFFRGQLVLALIVTGIFVVAGLLLGLPFALPMAFLAGLLEFLPSLGHAIWLLIASILALFAGSTWLPIPNWAFMLVVIGLHIFFEQFDLNYLIPRVIGQRVRLPPLVVILGIVAGAVLAGVIGILLAAPTIASARVLGSYVYANLTDSEPFPDSIVAVLPPPNPRWWRKARASTSSKAGLEP